MALCIYLMQQRRKINKIIYFRKNNSIDCSCWDGDTVWDSENTHQTVACKQLNLSSASRILQQQFSNECKKPPLNPVGNKRYRWFPWSADMLYFRLQFAQLAHTVIASMWLWQPLATLQDAGFSIKDRETHRWWTGGSTRKAKYHASCSFFRENMPCKLVGASYFALFSYKLNANKV
jgi:hypothetical protein